LGRVSTLTEARQTLAPRPPDLDCLGLPTLDPRLCLIYQPHRSETLPPPDPVRLLLESIRRVWSVLGDGAAGRRGRRPIGAWGLGLQPVAGACALLQPTAADGGPPRPRSCWGPPAVAPSSWCTPAPAPPSWCTPAVGPSSWGPLAPASSSWGPPAVAPSSLGTPAPGPSSWCTRPPAPSSWGTPAPGPSSLGTPAPGPSSWCTPAPASSNWCTPAPAPSSWGPLAPAPSSWCTPAPGRSCWCTPAVGPSSWSLPAPGPSSWCTPAVGASSWCTPAPGPRGWGWGLGPRATGPAVGGPEQPGPLGLSEARNPQKPPQRYGQRGLTPQGARQIQRAAAVLQDEVGKLSFWTVTLPDETIRELVARDLWPQFQTRIRDLLVRALKKRGLTPRVVGVVELHPSRSMRERTPLPHLHLLFHGSRHKWRRWLLTTADLDRIIRDAVRYVGLPAPNVSQAGRVEAVKWNAGAYLSKYMSKNGEAAWLEQVPGNLPRVWWFWSQPLRAQVLNLVVPVCWSFVSWLHRLPLEALEMIGAVRVRLEIPDPRAPSTWCVRWRRNEDLRRAADLWCSRDTWLQSQGFDLISWQP